MAGFRAVHYVNQFFGGLGGEDKADVGPSVRQGAVGPGIPLVKHWQGRGEIVATVVCGDNYAAANLTAAMSEILPLIQQQSPDVLLAGPAFGSGRYGMACARLCHDVTGQLGIPCVTGMDPENPGVLESQGRAYIVPTAFRVSGPGMTDALGRMAGMAERLANHETLGSAEAEGYIPRGCRRNILLPKAGAERAVDMLAAKLAGRPFETEVPLPQYDRAEPAGALPVETPLRLALVTEGGLVPQGNPDRLESARATKWLKYPLPTNGKLEAGSYYSVHGGFDTATVNSDPHRILPLDAVRKLMSEGVIQETIGFYYVTTGMTAPIARARQFGADMAQDLLAQRANMVLLTAT